MGQRDVKETEAVLGSGSGRIQIFLPIWDLESSPPDPDPDPALVIYIYQVIASKKMFLTNFLKNCCDRNHVKVFTIHM
jgi:hypothetical protein